MKKLEKRLIRRMDKLRCKRKSWIIENVIPSGIITAVIGKPEHGLQQVISDIAAKVSKGQSWPLGDRETTAGAVLIVVFAGDINRDFMPTLKVLSAYEKRVRFVSGFDLQKLEKGLVESIRDWLQGMGAKAKMVIIDDLGLAAVRTSQSKMIQELSVLAQERDVSIVCGIPGEVPDRKVVRKLEKTASPHRLAVFGLQGPDQGLGLVPFTIMLTPGAEPTAFALNRRSVKFGPAATYIEWDAKTTITNKLAAQKSNLDHARILLAAYLKNKDQVYSTDLHEEAGKLGFASRIATEVVKLAGFRKTRDGGSHAKVVWLRVGAKLEPKVSEAVNEDDYLLNIDDKPKKKKNRR